ncbi:single-stranded DNA-binding protein [Actinopolymorpha pittospori]|uniref:single-stranded DNA-binding protein n=1 Tax=Actinopolymorpha pittospori TaxID=648752 RepID=UPI003B5898CA
MISISGNVATDLRFARSDRGTSLVSFRLASTPRRYDRSQGGWVDGRTTYVTVVCWRSLAENVAASVHKGGPRPGLRTASRGDVGARRAERDDGRDRRSNSGTRPDARYVRVPPCPPGAARGELRRLGRGGVGA